MSKFPLFRFTRAAGRILCVAALALTFAGQALAGDDLPKFTDPEVTAYVKAYSEFTDQYIAAAKAAKAGDNSKMAGLDAKTQQLQGMTDKLTTKLKPEETEKFTEFLTKCAEKMMNASM